MAYSAGMMNKRVTVAKRATEPSNRFGKSGQPQYEIFGTFWMSETFSKGVKALHEGALDAYDTVMFRCRYNKDIDRWCLLQYNGKWYQITSFNADYHDNQLQMTAVELANQQVNIVDQPIHEIEVWMDQACTQRPKGRLTKVYAQFNVTLTEYKNFVNSESNIRYKHVEDEFVDYDEAIYYGKYSSGALDVEPISKGTVLALTLSSGLPLTFSENGDYSFGIVINR